MVDNRHLFPELMDPRHLAGPVLVLVPHPDDEVIGCGAMLAWHRDAGHRVVVVHATDGAQGDPEGRFADLAKRRREESARALAVLGVEEQRSLGFPDGTLGKVEGLDKALTALLEEIAPRTIYTISPLDCHCDHRVLGRVAAQVIAGTCPADTVCMVVGINNMGLPNTLVDITALLEKKEKALRCYATQLAYIDFATKVIWRDKAATVNIEDQAVVACEAFMRLPAERLPAFTREAGACEDILYGG